MNNFDIVKQYYTSNPIPISHNINTHMQQIIRLYYDLNQLDDWNSKYKKEPINQSDEYMDNYTYNKQLDTQRTRFDKKQMLEELSSELAKLMWELLTKAYIDNKDLNLVELNTKLQDGGRKSTEGLRYNATIAIAELRSYFNNSNEFIVQKLSPHLLEIIFNCILNLCSQFDIEFYQVWKKESAIIGSA